MFGHIYINRLKCILRDRQTMFWTALFPILLALFFYMSLSNVTKGEVFSDIPIAVVSEGVSEEVSNVIMPLKDVLTSMESEASDDTETNLFKVTYTNKEEAEQLLIDSKIAGYIAVSTPLDDKGLQMKVKNSGLEQTVIKSFLDEYRQTVATVHSILESNPAAATGSLFADLAVRENYLKAVSSGKAEPDLVVNYFYTLIAMACLYGGFLGLKEIIAVQANLSPQAARMNMAPTHKMKMCVASLLAATTIQIAITFAQIAFIVLVLGVDFGDQIGYIALTSVIGSFVGVTFGACVAAAFKFGEGIKVAVLIGFSMTMSFLSGMMVHDIKMVINENIPILGYLNPVNLIADSFYKLYYYTTYTQYFTNLIILCGFVVVFSLVTYLVLRRQRYASL